MSGVRPENGDKVIRRLTDCSLIDKTDRPLPGVLGWLMDDG